MRTTKQPMLDEEYQIIIQPAQMPNMLRLTYSNKKGKLIQIEEITAITEEMIGFCKYKGRSSNGTSCGWMNDIKLVYGQLKPTDWKYSGILIDEFYKYH